VKRISILLTILLILSSAAYADQLSPYRDKYIEGYLKEIYQDKAVIEEYDGTVHTISILRNAILRIDGVPVTYTDFIPGMEVYGELQGRSLKLLEAYSTENPGYIPPGKKVRSGIVVGLDFSTITIKLPSGENEIYTYTPATIITRKNNPTSIAKLYEGDSVRLYFDQYNTSTVSRIAVEGDSVLVSGIYKGTLTYNDNFDNRIILKDVKKLNNAKWNDHSSFIVLERNPDTSIYVGGQKINESNLKYYQGREAYIAVKTVFGQDTVERITLKANREKNYAEKITDVNFYSDSIKLNNMVNITINDGTIIVKNNRLVDKYSISSQSNAFVTVDNTTYPQANLVYIYSEDLNNSNIGQNYLYYGRLDEVVDYDILLHNYSVLERNQWESYYDDTLLSYDDDTYIYDLDNKKLVSVQEFQSGNYAVDEDTDYAEDNNLRDWYGYLYTDGNNILVMGLKEERDTLIQQRVTLGQIKSVENDPYVGYVINVTNASDWSNRKEGFMLKSQELRLMIDNALIVKDDKLISKEDLKPGDRLYIVRDDFQCKFILVR